MAGTTLQESNQARRDRLQETFMGGPVFSKKVTFDSTLFRTYQSQSNTEQLVSDCLKEKPFDSLSEEERLQVKQILEKYLNTDELNAAQTEYEDSIEHLKKIAPTHKTNTLITLLKEINENARRKIVTQQELGLEKIKTELHDTFPHLFKTSTQAIDTIEDPAVQIDDDSQAIDAAKDPAVQTDDDLQMIDESPALHTIKAFQKKLLDDVDSNNQKELTKLHAAEQKEIEAFLFWKNLSKNNPAMQNQKHTNSAATLHLNDTGCYISSDDIEALEKINPLGGIFGFKENVIQKTTDPKTNQTTYSVEFGPSLCPWNVGYFLLNKNKEQLLNMATLVRQAGHDSIVVNLDYTNDEMLKKTARRAFDACIKAGFDPDKITLNVKGNYLANKAGETTVNGQKVQAKSIQEELFSQQPNQYTAIINKVSKVQKMMEQSTKPYKKTSQQELCAARKELQQARLQTQQEKLLAQEQSAPASSNTLESNNASHGLSN